MLMLIFFFMEHSQWIFSLLRQYLVHMCTSRNMQSKYFIAIQLYTYICIVFDFWLTSETEGHMIALVTGSTPANNVRFCSFFVFEFSNFQNYKFCIKHAAEYMQLNTLLLG